MNKLTQKQQRFVKEYLVDACAAKAASRAGYSSKSAAKIGYELLDKTVVSDEIKRLQCERSRSLKVDAEMVVQELAAIAFSSVGEIFDWENNSVTLKPLHSIPVKAVKAIQYIKIDPDGSVSVRLHDKMEALKGLGKHLGLFREVSPQEASKRDPKAVLARVSEILKKRTGQQNQ